MRIVETRLLKSKIDAALLGKIVFARFLELPLRTFDRLVAQAESSIGHEGLYPWVTMGRLEGAQVADEATGIHQTQASPILGEIREAGESLMFLYRRDSYAREYRFDEEGLCRLMSNPNFPGESAKILRKLRLINSRNRLTHALILAVLALQAEYLRSELPLSLLPLTQAQMSERLRAQPGLSVVADPGRISRLIRGLSLALPNGKITPLTGLFPKPRQVHCHFVDYVIKKEDSLFGAGMLREPLTDGDIAEIFERECGIRLLRRTVANIRRDLAIPDYRSRSHRTNYLAATEGFSALVPLTAQALRIAVPTHPGVYEIRATYASGAGGDKEGWPWKSVPPGPHSVIYIGSAGDLRKRLGDHLRGSSGNALLYRYITDGTARVRFRLTSEGWRGEERELYRVFCETFGTPPPCNRMSP